MGIPTSGEWPIFEVLVNPRQLNLNADYVFLRRGEKWPKIGGLLPARPVLAQSAPPSSASAHKNRHPPPPSYLAFCEYRNLSKKHYYYYYPGVLVENELAQNGTLAFYYGLYTVHGSQVCDGVYVMAVLNTRPPPPPIDYRRRFNKLYNGEDNEEDEEDGESKETKNFKILGFSLPWVKTSRQHLPTIPKSFLVQLDYNKQQCIIPGKFPLSPNEQIQTIKDEKGIMDIPTRGEWPIFEVLLNPRRLNLDVSYVNLRQEGKKDNINGLLPARPVLAQSALSPLAHRNRHSPPSYLAFYRYQETSHRTDYFHFYPGVVQQVTENGTLVFYHGLYSVPAYSYGSVYVVAVLNSRMPPMPIDYRHRFNKM
ncbi:hypothetical protein TYRP_009033 [Tyrophagus putrescentiae]|nr:hypothetical protein TYRP_009033 [Tyrophagus putrescentiae]